MVSAQPQPLLGGSLALHPDAGLPVIYQGTVGSGCPDRQLVFAETAIVGCG